MSSELIAKVMHDFARGHVDTSRSEATLHAAGFEGDFHRRQMKVVAGSTVVDVTPLFHQVMERGEARDLYDDHLLAPPFPNASFCWVNGFDNVAVANVVSVTTDEWTGMRWESDAGTHTLDWNEVRWVLSVTLWAGGRSTTEQVAIPTQGPIYAWLVAVAADGHALDIRWVETTPIEHPTNAELMWLTALNFLNCRNVEITEPVRPRQVRRRIQRHGVRVHELTVYPTGRTTRHDGEPLQPGVPLTTVRGHFANYGTEGRGLLFGKYAGRYWRPHHARGSAEHGTVDKTYRVEP